jgi:hypothetical protein
MMNKVILDQNLNFHAEGLNINGKLIQKYGIYKCKSIPPDKRVPHFTLPALELLGLQNISPTICELYL